MQVFCFHCRHPGSGFAGPCHHGSGRGRRPRYIDGGSVRFLQRSFVRYDAGRCDGLRICKECSDSAQYTAVTRLVWIAARDEGASACLDKQYTKLRSLPKPRGFKAGKIASADDARERRFHALIPFGSDLQSSPHQQSFAAASGCARHCEIMAIEGPGVSTEELDRALKKVTGALPVVPELSTR